MCQQATMIVCLTAPTASAVAAWLWPFDSDLEVVDRGDGAVGPGFLRAWHGGVDTADLCFGDAEAEEAVTVFLRVAREGEAADGVGPGDRWWCACDLCQVVQVRVAAGA